MTTQQSNIENARISFELALEQAETSFFTKNNFYKFLNDNNLSFYDRTNLQGHVTSSCFVIDESHTQILLVDHKKVKRWLQPGGHWDNVPESGATVFDNAYKELTEEAFGDVQVPYKILNEGKPYDLDIHDIANHKHYDIGYLLEIDLTIPLVVSFESLGVSWFNLDYILKNNHLPEFSSIRLSNVIERIKNDKSLIKNYSHSLKNLKC